MIPVAAATPALVTGSGSETTLAEALFEPALMASDWAARPPWVVVLVALLTLVVFAWSHHESGPAQRVT